MHTFFPLQVQPPGWPCQWSHAVTSPPASPRSLVPGSLCPQPEVLSYSVTPASPGAAPGSALLPASPPIAAKLWRCPSTPRPSCACPCSRVLCLGLLSLDMIGGCLSDTMLSPRLTVFLNLDNNPLGYLLLSPFHTEETTGIKRLSRLCKVIVLIRGGGQTPTLALEHQHFLQLKNSYAPSYAHVKYHLWKAFI